MSSDSAVEDERTSCENAYPEKRLSSLLDTAANDCLVNFISTSNTPRSNAPFSTNEAQQGESRKTEVFVEHSVPVTKPVNLSSSLKPEPLTFSRTPDYNNPLYEDISQKSTFLPNTKASSASFFAPDKKECIDTSAQTSNDTSLGVSKSISQSRFISTYDRWRLYCFQYAFVLEPNIPCYGICYRFTQSQLYNLPNVVHSLNLFLDPTKVDLSQDPPQLIIFRFSIKIIEVKNLLHNFYSELGPLENLFLIDSFLGSIEIQSFRFLIVVSDSERVCGFNRESFEMDEAEVSFPMQGGCWKRDMFIYRIRQAYLIPYHVSLKKLLPLTVSEDQLYFKREVSEKPKGYSDEKISSTQLRETVAYPAFHTTTHANAKNYYPSACALTVSPTHLREKSLTTQITVSSEPVWASMSSQNSSASFFPNLDFGYMEKPNNKRFVMSRLKNLDPEDYSNVLAYQLGEKVVVLKRNVEKLLCTSFYYSYDCDITHTLQRKRQLSIPFGPQGWPCSDPINSNTDQANRTREKPICLLDIADERFVWNLQLIKDFDDISIDRRWLVPIIQGSVSSATIISGVHGLDLVLLCRRSWARAGTRFNHRGIDDSGAVANFNESEQLIALCRVESQQSRVIYRGPQILHSGWSSFVQIRGSVPLFWEQSSGLGLTANISLTRQLEFSIEAFHEHQKELSKNYGKICYIDLLSSAKGGENKLSLSLRHLINDYNQKICLHNSFLHSDEHPKRSFEEKPAHLIQLDCHQQIKLFGLEKALLHFVTHLRPQLDELGYYCEKPLYAERPVIQFQKGCLRVNCLDCLDRTNVFQWYICWTWISTFLKERNVEIFLEPAIHDRDLKLLKWDLFSSSAAATAAATTSAHPLSSHPLDGTCRKTLESSVSSFLSNSETTHVYYNGSDEGAFFGEYKSLRRYSCLQKSLPWEIGSDNMLRYPIVNDSELQELSKNVAKDVVARMWADQGDRISRAYTGTNSVMSSVIRQGKSSLTTNMAHMMTSLGRLYQNNFEDNCRQDAIDLLLQQYEPSLDQKGCDAFNPASSKFVPKLFDSPNVIALNGLCARIPQDTTLSPHHNSLLMLTDKQVQKSPSIPTHISSSTQNLAYTRPVRIWFGTWNMGGCFTTTPIPIWLFQHYRGGEAHEASTADIYVTAVQELVELTKVRVLLSQNDREKEEQLESAIKKALGSHFIMLKSHSLVGLHLAVFVRSSFKHYVTKVHVSELKLGFKGQMGNKGAVFLRFTLADVSFCFVNVHLSSGPEKAKQRREQLNLILDSAFQTRLPYRVQNHDCVFLGGDFNFRCSTTYRETMELVKREYWKDLLFFDQFVVGKRIRLPPFHNIYEGEINFSPTYKFKKDTNIYDEGRSPGWCDRVLYTGNILNKSPLNPTDYSPTFECVAYEYIPSICTSDHKPVYAVFETKVTFNLMRSNNHFNCSSSLMPLPTQQEFHKSPVAVLSHNKTQAKRTEDVTPEAQDISLLSPGFSQCRNSFTEQHLESLVMPKVDSGTRKASFQKDASSPNLYYTTCNSLSRDNHVTPLSSTSKMIKKNSQLDDILLCVEENNVPLSQRFPLTSLPLVESTALTPLNILSDHDASVENAEPLLLSYAKTPKQFDLDALSEDSHISQKSHQILTDATQAPFNNSNTNVSTPFPIDSVLPSKSTSPSSLM